MTAWVDGLVRAVVGLLSVWSWTTLTFVLLSVGEMHRKLAFVVVVAFSTFAYLVVFWLPVYVVLRRWRKRRPVNYAVGALVSWVPFGAVSTVFGTPVMGSVSGAVIALAGGVIAYYVVERLCD